MPDALVHQSLTSFCRNVSDPACDFTPASCLRNVLSQRGRTLGRLYHEHCHQNSQAVVYCRLPLPSGSPVSRNGAQ